MRGPGVPAETVVSPEGKFSDIQIIASSANVDIIGEFPDLDRPLIRFTGEFTTEVRSGTLLIKQPQQQMEQATDELPTLRLELPSGTPANRFDINIKEFGNILLIGLAAIALQAQIVGGGNIDAADLQLTCSDNGNKGIGNFHTRAGSIALQALVADVIRAYTWTPWLKGSVVNLINCNIKNLQTWSGNEISAETSTIGNMDQIDGYHVKDIYDAQRIG